DVEWYNGGGGANMIAQWDPTGGTNFVDIPNSAFTIPAPIGNGTGITVSGANNTIGGTTSGARNIISGNTNTGVQIAASGVTVQGNYIGVDVTGTTKPFTATVPSSKIGILDVANNNTIGGTTTGARNVISNSILDGIRIGNNVSGVVVQGNYI